MQRKVNPQFEVQRTSFVVETCFDVQNIAVGMVPVKGDTVIVNWRSSKRQQECLAYCGNL